MDRNTLRRYESENMHDACGTGFIAELDGKPSRRVLSSAISALKRLDHRGARSADMSTGDGAGLLMDIPADFFHPVIGHLFGHRMTEGEKLGVAQLFCDPEEQEWIEELFADLASEYSLTFPGSRRVPVRRDALGEMARESCPLVLQLFFICCDDRPHFEKDLFVIRKRAEGLLRQQGSEAFICSLSSRTIVYKGLLTAQQVEAFYPDLTDENFKVKVAVFHERFSTNTLPQWSMAQPFRFMGHNGEINTVKGNRLWMKSRERDLDGSHWGDDLKHLLPIVSSTGSDTLSLDNALEFLTMSGRSILHAMMMLVPEPYLNDPGMSDALRDFYIYHENFMEPWDGPAALVFTDGRYVAAKLDRNGLRPLRYTITNDGLVIMASEAGVVDVGEQDLKLHHHMTSGEIFALSLDGEGILSNAEIKASVASAADYSGMIRENFRMIPRSGHIEEFSDFALPEGGFDTRLRLLFGWNEEDLSRFIIPMAQSGREPMGSMGADIPLAIFSKQDRKLYDHFKQSFAQVTNPPIDPIREDFVTSLHVFLGSEEKLLSLQPRFQGALRLESPILSPREMKILLSNGDQFPYAVVHCHFRIGDSLSEQLARLQEEAARLAEGGTRILLLSDEDSDREHLPIPMPLVISALHQHLTREQLRSRVSLIAATGDVLADHHLAVLVAMGASAVYPYMAYELIREQFDSGDWTERMQYYRYALEKGLLKIMAKMGISTFRSYHGSMLLHAVGLGRELMEQYFPQISCTTGGIGLGHIEKRMAGRLERAFMTDKPVLPELGIFKFRKNGELHGYSPSQFKTIFKLAAGVQDAEFPKQDLIYLRDLLDIRQGEALPLEQVEDTAALLRRFGSGAISLGAISDESHRVIARGMSLIRGRSNTGEGGEAADRYTHGNPDTSANSYVKQVASARFGVNTDYLAAAREIQIKIAQGAKPGEGGQLPGHKVTLDIASARNSTPGVPLISPPPHHDIYSIEDLAQLIHDLKQVNPRAKISVKLVSQPGIGTVAAGVAKAEADIILISGGDGGTGASPLGSLKNAGMPWELGLSETHRVLTANGLRDRVTLRVDGGIRGHRDILIAALLGAEEFDFGTGIMIAIGCVMARQCHLNTCPAGIATQDPDYRKRFKGRPEQIEAYLRAVASRLREDLASLGAYSLGDIVGRSDLLQVRKEYETVVRDLDLDLSAILPAEGEGSLPLTTQSKVRLIPERREATLDEGIIEEVRPAIMTHGQAVVRRQVRNRDRAVGTRLSGELSFLFGKGNFNGNILYQLEGAAGQSLGAFLTDGVEIQLKGVANDFVGKGMSGGLIAIRMSREIRYTRDLQTVMGNVALYGASGGMLLVAGRAGERFAVRNAGASAVVEGIGNHGCEYMTRGVVVVLGDFGRNFGAGMTGGLAYLYDVKAEARYKLNHDFIRVDMLNQGDLELLQSLLNRHHFRTRSHHAKHILDHWDTESDRFIKVIPKAMDIIDFKEVYDQQIAKRLALVLNE